MTTSSTPDFIAVARRYAQLGAGPKADLRRVAKPDDLALVPAFYHLLAGIHTDARWQQLVFFLPCADHAEHGAGLGQQLAKAGISEARLFQVLRSTTPNDLIQLRRLVQQVQPRVDWQRLGAMLYYWNDRNKRRLIEDYFYPLADTEKDAKS